jgi:hypothetical protein
VTGLLTCPSSACFLRSFSSRTVTDWELDSGQRWFVAVFATLMVWGFYGLCLRAIKPPPTTPPTAQSVGPEGEARTGG